MTDRYCAQCGHSLLPLQQPHLARSCDTCGKTIHLIELGEGGKGIRVRAGDKFTIPAGSISLSLDPTRGGKLYRPGLPFLIKQFLYSGVPASAEQLPDLIEKYKQQADSILKASELLEGLDLEEEGDGARAVEILKNQPNSREWHALLLGAFCEAWRDALQQGNAQEAAWAACQAALAYAMTVVTEPVFEQTLWRGYLANQVLYEAATAASATPGEAEAIQKLQPLFARLDEATLHAWVESGLPIGPRIGVTALPEPLIAALARFHLAGFQRQREDDRRLAEEKRFIRDLRVKWASIGVAASGALVVILKAVGVL